MNSEKSISSFIERLARKLSYIYKNNCANEEDYIQAGHLKLAEIRGAEKKSRDFVAYAIVSITRAMSREAIEATGIVSAPYGIKKQIRQVSMLLADGKTESEICMMLNMKQNLLSRLVPLVENYSFDTLFERPSGGDETFCVVDDILSSKTLTMDDKDFILAHLDGAVDNLKVDRKHKWLKRKSIQSKLVRSGYGI